MYKYSNQVVIITIKLQYVYVTV